MKIRVLTSIIGLCIFLPILIFANGPVFRVFYSLISAIVAFEVVRCVDVAKKYALSLPMIALGFGLPLFAGCSESGVLAIIFIFILYFMFSLVFNSGSISLAEVGASFTTVLYCAISFSCVILLRENFSWAFFMVYIGAWVCDTFAYLTGMICGKHPLIPKVSPKKTVEGATGGTVATIIAFVVFGYIMESYTDYSVRYILMAILGLICAVAAQLGDLIMSAIKRCYAIKDFGRIFPGHGGVLDRFDSTLTLSPLLFVAFSFFKILYL